MENRSNKLDRSMSRGEAQCFRIIRKWQRKALLRNLRRAIFPGLPYYSQFSKAPAGTRFWYFLLVLILMPLLIIAAIFRGLYVAAMFPYRYLSTYIVPHDIKAPGEASIQGIHHAFSNYFELPTDFYLCCVDDWVETLYGSEALNAHRMEFYVDLQKIMNMETLKRNEDVTAHLRSTVHIAREQLSKELGSYRN